MLTRGNEQLGEEGLPLFSAEPGVCQDSWQRGESASW